jgi:uncharacterized SAM-binding protein YcdF (DUF218 family)
MGPAPAKRGLLKILCRFGAILRPVSLRRFLSNRLLWFVLALFMGGLAVYVLRFPLLRATGNFLISSDPIQPVDAVYVLGGSSLDRGLAGHAVLQQGVAPVVYCLGANIPSSLEAEGLMITEGQLTTNVMLRAGSDPRRVRPLPEGTSTQEEAIAILAHARQLGMDTIMVISTHHHTRRVGMVFRRRFREQGIHVVLLGAPSSQYDAQRWWEREEGLLMVNNEYVKLLYYMLKY